MWLIHSKIMEKRQIRQRGLERLKDAAPAININRKLKTNDYLSIMRAKIANISTCIERVILRGTFKQLMTANWSRWPVVNLGD